MMHQPTGGIENQEAQPLRAGRQKISRQGQAYLYVFLPA
jgi:hypothetical protein